MVSYGWTIDYINENVTIPQMIYLMEEIIRNPPTAILGFSLGNKKNDETLMAQINKFGDKVKVDKWFNKESVKSVTRLRDKVKLK